MVDLRLWQMLSLGCGTLFWLAMGVWILKGMAYGDECFEVDENDPVLKTYHRYFLLTGISGAGGVSKSMLKKSRLDFDKIEKCE